VPPSYLAMARELQENEEFLSSVRANQGSRLRTYYAELRTDLEEKISVTEDDKAELPVSRFALWTLMSYQNAAP